VGSPFPATHYLPTSVTFMELSICDTWVRPSASGQAARGHWRATILFAIFARSTYFTPVSDHTTQGKIQSQKILMAPFHGPASCLTCFAFPPITDLILVLCASMHFLLWLYSFLLSYSILASLCYTVRLFPFVHIHTYTYPSLTFQT